MYFSVYIFSPFVHLQLSYRFFPWLVDVNRVFSLRRIRRRGNIGSSTEETTPKDENETPQIKETLREASGTNPESPVPKVPSIPVINSIIPSYCWITEKGGEPIIYQFSPFSP
jgi:hypothetical protein